MATDKEQSILTEAQAFVHGDRNSDYGHLLDDFSRTAAIWTALLGGKPGATARASSRKTLACAWSASSSRQINRPKRDNPTDAAGYCETVRDGGDEKARREIPALISDGSHRSTGSINASFPILRIGALVLARNGLAMGVEQRRHRQHMSDAGMDDGAFEIRGR